MKIKKFLAAFSVAAVALVADPSAWSATQSVTANIRFDTPLAITLNNNIDFGSVQAGVADTYTISPTGATSHSGSGAFLFGTPTAGSVGIVGSTTQTLNITSSFTNSAHVTLANATCKYGAGAAGSCTIPAAAAPGAGTTLLVGVDAQVSATAPSGTAETPSITLTIAYN